MSNVNNQNNVKVEKPAFADLPAGVSLTPEIIAMEALFNKQVNRQQAEVVARLERGQHEVNVLNMLLNAVNGGTQDDGLQINDTIKQGVARLLQLDPQALQEPFVDPKSIDDEIAKLDPNPDHLKEEKRELERKRKAAVDRLTNEANILARLNLPFAVTYAGKEVNFQNLIAELNAPENAAHPLKKLFNTIGFDGAQPTDAQLQSISAAANQADPSKPNEAFEARAIRELLQKHNLLESPAKLDKRNAQQLTHSLQSLMKEKEAVNGLDQKKSSQLESQINKMYEALISAINKISDAIRKIAGNIR